MKKNKLIEVRKKKGFSQQQIANCLYMDVSNYNRREKGLVKITHKEWDKLTAILEVPVEEIFESEDGIFLIKDNLNSNNTYKELSTIPLYVLENQQKYIQRLEDEIQLLKRKYDE